jgi:hypothetical protein
MDNADRERMPPPRSIAAAVQPMRLQRPATTFADALARLRQHIRFERFATSANAPDIKQFLPSGLQQLLEIARYAP